MTNRLHLLLPTCYGLHLSNPTLVYDVIFDLWEHSRRAIFTPSSLYYTILTFNKPDGKRLLKIIVRKGENADYESFLFPLSAFHLFMYKYFISN